MKLTFLLCYKQTGFSPHGARFCYLVEADIFVCAVKRVTVAMSNTCGRGSRRVRAVQTYLTAESKEVPECGGGVVRLGTLS